MQYVKKNLFFKVNSFVLKLKYRPERLKFCRNANLKLRTLGNFPEILK